MTEDGGQMTEDRGRMTEAPDCGIRKADCKRMAHRA